MLSGSTEEPDNTRMVANQTINIKRFSWRQVEMRNLTYTLSPHSPFAALTDPLKRGKRALTDLVVGSGRHFDVEKPSFMLMA